MTEDLTGVEIDQIYEKLLDLLLNEPINMDGLLAGAFNSAQMLSELLPLGQASMKVIAPPNVYLPKGEDKEYIFFQQESPDCKNPFIREFETQEGGTALITFLPLKGCLFSQTQTKLLSHYAKLLFTFGGRTRIGILLSRALTSDSMTGLPNLTTFMSFATKQIALHQISTYDAFYLNIKNFKYINKIVSYHNGDAIMVQYARKLAAFAGEDEIIARLGGDNYVALIKHAHTDAFKAHISAIELTVDTSTGTRQVILGAVAGIYEVPETVHNPSEIMMPISVALQTAKQVVHTDFAYYSPQLAQKILDGQKVSIDFPQSMANGEFVAFLQPKYNPITNQICGAEALARWLRNGEIIPPAAFIPVLEKDGSICKLDFEILRQTCAQIAHWKKEGKVPPRISVNLSRWHLQNPNLVQDVMNILNQYQVDPSLIEIELTETMDYDEYAILAKLFHEFTQYGLTTSIDDFGTGYSSLKLLLNLDVDVLKLDRSFLQNIYVDQEGSKEQILVRNVINMAKELKLEVLAEGVETEEQRDFLVQAGCDVIQGFLYAKPMPISEFEQRMW